MDTAPDHYVGSPGLHLFDVMISLAADVNRHAAAQSFSPGLSKLQRAAADILPGAFHIAQIAWHFGHPHRPEKLNG
jgi:hypothetical protein